MGKSPKVDNRAAAAPPRGAVPERLPPPGSSSRQIGYSPEELQAVPAGADLGLGCGNPQAIAALLAGGDRSGPGQRRPV